MRACKTTADLPVVINYKQTMGYCFSKAKQVEETGLVRIIQMNCSCLHREKGILTRWAACNGLGNSICIQHIYTFRINSLTHRDVPKTLDELLLFLVSAGICAWLTVNKFQYMENLDGVRSTSEWFTRYESALGRLYVIKTIWETIKLQWSWRFWFYRHDKLLALCYPFEQSCSPFELTLFSAPFRPA